MVQEILMATLRLVDIVGAVLWVGMAFGFSVLVFPAILRGNSFGFLKELFLGTAHKFAFPIVSITLSRLQRQLIQEMRKEGNDLGRADGSSTEEVKAVLIKDSHHGIMSLCLTSIALLFMGIARFL